MTIEEIYENAKRKLDKNEITIGEFAEIVDREVHEPKVGHWIMTGDYYTGAYGCIDYVECSCCHEESLEEGNYCPNCGARMAESEKTE